MIPLLDNKSLKALCAGQRLKMACSSNFLTKPSIEKEMSRNSLTENEKYSSSVGPEVCRGVAERFISTLLDVTGE